MKIEYVLLLSLSLHTTFCSEIAQTSSDIESRKIKRTLSFSFRKSFIENEGPTKFLDDSDLEDTELCIYEKSNEQAKTREEFIRDFKHITTSDSIQKETNDKPSVEELRFLFSKYYIRPEKKVHKRINLERMESKVTELKPYCPVLSKVTEKKEETPSAYEVALFLLHQDAVLKEKQGHLPLSKSKLCALLVIAQGFYYLLHDSPLYCDTLEFVSTSSHTTILPEGITPKNFPLLFIYGNVSEDDKTEALAHYTDDAVSSEKKKFLALILTIYSSHKGTELEKSLQKMSSINKGAGKNISREALKSYYLNHQRWLIFCADVLCTLSEEEDFDGFFSYIREYISYCFFAKEAKGHDVEIELVQKVFNDRKDRLEEQRSIRYCKWSTDTSFFQGLMGHLFFPVQFEKQFEPLRQVYRRKRIQKLLAYSAFYKNPLALHFINIVFELLCEDELTSYLSKDAQKTIQDFLNDEIDTQQPLFFAGLLCLENFDRTKALKYFVKAAEHKDAWAIYTYATLLRDPLREDLRQIMEETQPGLALLLKAVRESNSDERLRLFEETGKLCISYGNKKAGEIYESKKNNIKAHSLYKKALEAGQLDVCQQFIDLLLKKSDNNTDFRLLFDLKKTMHKWAQIDLTEEQYNQLKRISGCSHELENI